MGTTNPITYRKDLGQSKALRKAAGRIVCELFSDLVPRTAQNFRALCTGEMGMGIHGKPLHYKGCPFHRVVPGFMIQSGDFTRGDGSGGEAVYGPKFDDESFDVRHSAAGLLTMANRGPNSNGSQFMILTKASPSLDRKHVAFGRVVEGMAVVGRIQETCGVAHSGDFTCPTPHSHEVVAFRPGPTAYIIDCGDLLADGDQLALADASLEPPPSKRPRTESSVDKAAEVVHVYHILKKHSGLRWPQTWQGKQATCTRAKAKIAVEGLRKRLVAAPNIQKAFVELAREYSDEASSQRGGDLGDVGRGELDERIEDVVFGLPAGGLSEVFETEEGVHLALRAA